MERVARTPMHRRRLRCAPCAVDVRRPRAAGSAIQIGASNAGLELDVSGNELFGEGVDDGIAVIAAAGADVAARIANNAISGQTDGDHAGGAIAIGVIGSTGEFIIVNNSVAFNDAALRLNRDGPAFHADIFNNVIAFNGAGLVLEGTGLANAFNLVFGNGSDSFTPGPGTRQLDPLFVSPEDLTPRPESPVRNAGSNARVPTDLTVDLAGAPRIVGSKVDIGAYELVPEPSGALAAAAAAGALGALRRARGRSACRQRLALPPRPLPTQPWDS